MTTKSLEIFERFLHTNFLDVLHISPIDSLTPFQVGNEEGGQEEFLFIGKLSPYVYEPFKGRSLNDHIPIKMAMYIENDSLIIQFDILDVLLETEIRPELIQKFLPILYQQEKITVAIVDGYNYKLVWLTNTIPFGEMRHHYQEVFDRYGINPN